MLELGKRAKILGKISWHLGTFLKSLALLAKPENIVYTLAREAPSDFWTIWASVCTFEGQHLQRSEQKVAFEGAKRQKVTKLDNNSMRAKRAAIFLLFAPQVGLLSASLKKTQCLLHRILGEGP
jgi:hypothetical protein